MVTGSQIRVARILLGWEPARLAEKAKVPVSVVMRAEKSAGEPVVTIAQLDALLKALRRAGAEFPREADLAHQAPPRPA